MTDRKHFKHLVRERMRHTGERYTVARRHVAADATPRWELRGGLDGDTAAFANVLANLGVEAGGAPLSEAMVLGAGGGLGAGYILWEFEAQRRARASSRWGSGASGSTRRAGPPSWRPGSGCTRRSTRPAA